MVQGCSTEALEASHANVRKRSFRGAPSSVWLRPQSATRISLEKDGSRMGAMAMKQKKFFQESELLFVLVLAINPIVVYVWNLVRHGEGRFDWGTTFVLAITFAILFPVLSASKQRFRASSS